MENYLQCGTGQWTRSWQWCAWILIICRTLQQVVQYLFSLILHCSLWLNNALTSLHFGYEHNLVSVGRHRSACDNAFSIPRTYESNNKLLHSVNGSKTKPKERKKQICFQETEHLLCSWTYTYHYSFRRGSISWRECGEKMKMTKDCVFGITSIASSVVRTEQTREVNRCRNIFFAYRAGESARVLRPEMLVWGVKMMKYHHRRMLGTSKRVEVVIMLLRKSQERLSAFEDIAFLNDSMILCCWQYAVYLNLWK